MAYAGSCHCGAVTFTVEGDVPTDAIGCNCSHCRRQGLLLTFVPADAFALTAGEEALETYRFNTHVIAHRFCTTCGSQPFAEGKGKNDAPTVSVNLRCVPDADLEALKINFYDGAKA